jgi:predicted GIY-YIG superfamily endonuclease
MRFLGEPGREGVWFVYILANAADAEHFHVGMTQDVHVRLVAHNAGQVPHTAKFRPWRLKTYIAFSDRARAIAFELYLKSGSGRAFTKKRL